MVFPLVLVVDVEAEVEVDELRVVDGEVVMEGVDVMEGTESLMLSMEMLSFVFSISPSFLISSFFFSTAAAALCIFSCMGSAVEDMEGLVERGMRGRDEVDVCVELAICAPEH